MNRRRSIHRAGAALLLCGLLPLLPDAAHGAWPRHFDNTVFSDTTPVRMVVDPSDGDVFMAWVFERRVVFDEATGAQATPQGGTDVYVVKYDRLGEFQWVRTAESSGRLTLGGMALDDSGGLYIAGSFDEAGATFGEHFITLDPHYFRPTDLIIGSARSVYLAKLREEAGAGEWDFVASAERISIPGLGETTYPFGGDITDLTISGQHAYASAWILRYGRDGGTVFYNTQGIIWRFSIDPGSERPPGMDSGYFVFEGAFGVSQNSRFTAIEAGENRVFFAGQTDYTNDEHPASPFSARLNLSNSTTFWENPEEHVYDSIAVDSNGDPHFAGGDQVRKRIGSTGALAWTRGLPSARAVTLDAADNVYVLSANLVVSKYPRGSLGIPEWSNVVSASGNQLELQVIAVRGDDVSVAGRFLASGTATFGGVSVQGRFGTNFVANLEAVGGNWFESSTWIAGQEIPPPQGVPDPPLRPMSDIPDVNDPESYFYWDETTYRYYAVRQVAGAALRWPTGPEPDAPTIRTNGRTDWPADPQLHVPGAAVYLQPDGLAATFEELLYAESQDATVDADIFRSSGLGFSVLRYTSGGQPRFEIARTVPPEDPSLMQISDSIVVVGNPVSVPPEHEDPGGGTGHVVLPARIDAIGPDRAYDVATRQGPILSVNGPSEEQLVVAWYRTSNLGIGWPYYRRHYAYRWPALTDLIVIDRLVGSEYAGQPVLDPAVFRQARLYIQNDPDLPGFNPNEEHALLAPSNPDLKDSGFQAVFALRRQVDISASEPYALLKYRDGGGQWRIKPYRVINTVSGNEFAFDVEVTQLVPRPYPLGEIPGCTGTFGEGDPYWEDVRGNVYARSDGEMFVSYSYPLLAGFHPDPGTPVDAAGCVPWLDELPDPRVLYRASWPAASPLLQVGETLITPKNGLPDIHNQAAVEVIYNGDEMTPSRPFDDPIHLVKLFDPLSVRSVAVDPADADLFREVIREAPSHLALRLTYDEVLGRLGFGGHLDDSVLGDPLLLLNVMSEREHDTLQALRACDGVCDSVIDELFALSRNPRRLDLDGNDVVDEDLRIGLDLDPETGRTAGRRLVGEPGVLSAGAARGEGYVTLAFNNDLDLSLPVSLEVIRVACGPYQGSVHVLPTDNVFDERLTLRHSGDFGGEPQRFEFEWFRRMERFDPDDPGDTVPPGSWQEFPLLEGRMGALDVTVRPELGNPAELIIPDNYYFVRYTDNEQVCSGPSAWAGDPGGTVTRPVAKLAEGWIKRVIRGLNPFQARTTDFHTAPANTYASLLIQAGEPYAGPIAFNGDPEGVNNIGLIEAYETVLRRGIGLTLDAPSPFFSDAVGTALLLAAGRISDLHMLLGNEAAADAADPTIGFGTASGEYGTLAPSIFAFQNQLPSLLDEELALLRGRDGSGAAVNLHPVFNRLIWNFTSGEGELAYAQVYNVSDQGGDGLIDEADARFQYPQGHGDAWGHYLTALKSHYRLLRHDDYTWTPRAEQVAVAGTAVTVDYRDERKLAAAAAARARTGAEIVNLTYRRDYVEDPAGQWQGYKDAVPERAWGVDGWARRAGQGAYFDWVTANALLPDEWEQPGARPCSLAGDPDFAGDFPPEECPDVPDAASFPAIGRIDRTTVPEISEIVCHFDEVQTRLDEADLGLNPLGLAKGVVPFDVDPSQVAAGESHFEQIYDRAARALTNTVTVFDRANRLTESLRRNQDTLEDFRRNVEERERDFMNRLIEIFGLPYLEDVGSGGTYPPGYEGPDIYHYQYVDPTELTGAASGPTQIVEAFFSPLPGSGFFPGDDAPADPDAEITVEYVVEPSRLGLVKPASWGTRPAPGEIQRVLSDYHQLLTTYERALQEYDNLLEEIDDAAEILATITDATAAEISIRNQQLERVESLNSMILRLRGIQVGLHRAGQTARFLGAAIADSLPKVSGLSNDVSFAARGALIVGGVLLGETLEAGGDRAEVEELDQELARDELALTTAIRLVAEVPDVEAERQVRALEQLVRREPVLRLEAFNRREALAQTIGLFRTVLARGLRLLDERASFRARTAAEVQEYRYQDVAFRVTRHDALQKYRAQFDLAARYAYLAATAYDYETNLLGSADGAGRDFLTDVVRHRGLGEVVDGVPVPGSRGLADSLARLRLNYEVLEGQLGFNNPQTETTPFSLRRELLRLRDTSGEAWREELMKYRVENLWEVPEFRRYARPFAPEPPPGQSEPGLVIGFEGHGGRPLSTTVTTGQNFFGWPLGGGDSTYDTTNFATRIRSVGVWLGNYAASGLSATPRVYLIPVGADVLRPPTAGEFTTREWVVMDQALPVPFPIGASDLDDPGWIPLNDSLSGELGGIRRFSRFRAYHDSGSFDPSEATTDSRLIGRSVWNTRWLLVIPGETLLADKERGLDLFIERIDDIKLFFQTYAYSGN